MRKFSWNKRVKSWKVIMTLTMAVTVMTMFRVNEHSDLDEDDDLPFICEECGQVFKTQLWFCRHMQRGKHKKPAVSMKDFVHK